MKCLRDIRIRDPFILADPSQKTYYLYGTTDPNPWNGPAVGFDAWRSNDLVCWEGPLKVFRPPVEFWGTTQFWAPEVWVYQGRYFMFASFKAPGICRGTQVLVSDSPEGPFIPWSVGPVTPPDWECLDGTFFLDRNQDPWLVFCHEWLQVGNGKICAVRLSPDLKKSQGTPQLLFQAGDAPWTQLSTHDEVSGLVTDGPFLFPGGEGALCMLWSSHSIQGYAMAVATSPSGSLEGPWFQADRPFFPNNGGHGMTFRTFTGEYRLVLHQPNESPHERAVLIDCQLAPDLFSCLGKCQL